MTTNMTEVIITRPHLGPGGVSFYRGQPLTVTRNRADRLIRQKLAREVQTAGSREIQAGAPHNIETKTPADGRAGKVSEFAQTRTRDNSGRFVKG